MRKLPDFVANNTAKRLKTDEIIIKHLVKTTMKQGYQQNELTLFHKYQCIDEENSTDRRRGFLLVGKWF
jgi:hypothetical protein